MSYNDWENYSLEDVCIRITDGSHYSPKESGGKYPMLSVKDMKDNGFDYSKCKMINALEYTRLLESDCVPLVNDVLVAKDGSYMKHVFVTKKFKEEAILSSIAVLRPNLKKIIPNYLKYYLLNPPMLSKIKENYVSGSAVPRIVLKDFKKMPLKIPPIGKQKAIANILLSLDDKIELNKKINKNLEELTQTLYKRWFVDFEFPNEDGEPYKSSGGEMVESELGLIPKGWEVKSIGEICNIVLGGTPSRKIEEYWNGDIKWINSGAVNQLRIIHPSEMITRFGLQKSSTKLMPKKTTVIAITGATLGAVSLLEIDTCANQSVIGIYQNENVPYSFIYSTIKNSIEDIIGRQTGGAQQHINKNDVNTFKIILPDISTLKSYHCYTDEVFNEIANRLFQNDKLVEIRDTLLPKLMSGEIKVPIGE